MCKCVYKLYITSLISHNYKAIHKIELNAKQVETIKIKASIFPGLKDGHASLILKVTGLGMRSQTGLKTQFCYTTS